MKLRSLILGAMVSGLTAGLAAPAMADLLELAISTNPQSFGPAEIKVDGPGVNGSYTKVVNTSLDYRLSLRGDKPSGETHPGKFTLEYSADAPVTGLFHVDAKVEDYIAEHWTQYEISAPYVDPWVSATSNHRMSPVQFCNDVLASKTGAARQQMLKQGYSAMHQQAYAFRAGISYGLQMDGESLVAPVKITCLPLDRIHPHTQSTTKPGPAPIPQPTLSEVSLRIEPAQLVKDGKFLCPSQLKLYGHVEVIRKFSGKAIFVGPHYLSPVTVLSFQKAGERNLVGTYPMDWHKIGGLAVAPNVGPKKQTLTFRLNVATSDDKLLGSGEKTVEVSCRKIKVDAPTDGSGMTTTPAN